eukprot:CAMPEP_0114678962 /NCGR_PEP_ID=MMETSP0191-20121206/52388_1 /TAXON_ID=126664 /ORGANISM="Sorites sp." /LENGTH=35 /DNA_ID=CAMNT_0001953741 /DNA_START=340 /DNA_END=444 /DNA_ORIENTATION=+
MTKPSTEAMNSAKPSSSPSGNVALNSFSQSTEPSV